MQTVSTDRMVVAIAMASIATWSAVEIWHHGEIFAGLRKKFKKLGDNGSRFRLVGRLFSCPFCLSVWVAVVMTGQLFEWLVTGDVIWIVVPSALAVSRLANLMNDYTTNWNLTPKEKTIFRLEDDEPDDGWSDEPDRLDELDRELRIMDEPEDE